MDETLGSERRGNCEREFVLTLGLGLLTDSRSKNREAGDSDRSCPGLNRLAETFSLIGHCPHPID